MDDDPARQSPVDRRGGRQVGGSQDARASRLNVVTHQSQGPAPGDLAAASANISSGDQYLSSHDSFAAYGLPFDGLGGNAGGQPPRQDLTVRAPSQTVFVPRHPHDIQQPWQVSRNQDPLLVHQGNDEGVDSEVEGDPAAGQERGDEGDEEFEEGDEEGSAGDPLLSVDPNSTAATDAQSRPRKCPFPGCPRTFFKEAHVVRHLVVHTKERNHRCPLCDATFSRADSRDRHMSRTHKMSKEEMREMPEWSATLSTAHGRSSRNAAQNTPVPGAGMRATMTYLPGVGLVRRGADASNEMRSVLASSRPSHLGVREHMPATMSDVPVPGGSSGPTAAKRKRTDAHMPSASPEWTPGLPNRAQPAALSLSDPLMREQPTIMHHRLTDPYGQNRETAYPPLGSHESTENLRHVPLRSSYGALGPNEAYNQVGSMAEHAQSAHQQSTLASSSNAYHMAEQAASAGQPSGSAFLPWRGHGAVQPGLRPSLDDADGRRRDPQQANDLTRFSHLPQGLEGGSNRLGRSSGPNDAGSERTSAWAGVQGARRGVAGGGAGGLATIPQRDAGGNAQNSPLPMASSSGESSGGQHHGDRDDRNQQQSLDAWLSAYATQINLPETASGSAGGMPNSSATPYDHQQRVMQTQPQDASRDNELTSDLSRHLSESALRLQHTTVMALTANAPNFFPSETMERYLRAAQQMLRHMPCIPLIPLQEFGKNEPSVMMGLIVLGSLNNVRDGKDSPPGSRALAREWFLHNVSSTAAATWVKHIQNSDVIRLLQCVVVQELYAAGDGAAVVQQKAQRAWDDASSYALSKIGNLEQERWHADLDVESASTRAWYLWRSSESRGRALTALIVLDSQRSRGKTSPRLLPLLQHVHIPAPESLFRAESLEAWLLMARDFNLLLSRHQEATMPDMLQDLYREERRDTETDGIEYLQSRLPEHAQSLLLEAVHLNSMVGGDMGSSGGWTASPRRSAHQPPSPLNISRTFTALTNWRHRWENLVELNSRKDELLLEFRWNAIALNVLCPPEVLFEELTHQCPPAMLQSETKVSMNQNQPRAMADQGTFASHSVDFSASSSSGSDSHPPRQSDTGRSARQTSTWHLGVPFAVTILAQFRELPSSFLVPPQIIAAASDAMMLLAMRALRMGREPSDVNSQESNSSQSIDIARVWRTGSKSVIAWHADEKNGSGSSNRESATNNNDGLVEQLLGWSRGAWADGLAGSLRLISARVCAEEMVGWRDAARVLPVLRCAVRLAKEQEDRLYGRQKASYGSGNNIPEGDHGTRMFRRRSSSS